MSDYRNFTRRLSRAQTETKTKAVAFPLLGGMRGGGGLRQPDLYSGANPITVDLQIREALSKTIIPSKNTSAPILPNFFLEFKGPDGTPAVARKQILHDGPLGIRAMKSIKEWKA